MASEVEPETKKSRTPGVILPFFHFFKNLFSFNLKILFCKEVILDS